MNTNDTLISPPLLNKKMKKPVSEQFGGEYVDSRDAMSEIMDRKRHRQMLRLAQKEKQYAELRLQDNWAETARRLYSDYSEMGESQDFTTCERPDGSKYGTGGQCRKGKETKAESDARRARLQGDELKKIEKTMKGKNFEQQAKMIREAKARAEKRYNSGEEIPALPVNPPLQGTQKLKHNLKMRRMDEKATLEERARQRKRWVEGS